MKHRSCIVFLLHIILILLSLISNAQSQFNSNFDNGNLDDWIVKNQGTITDPSNRFVSNDSVQSGSLFRIVLLPDTQIYSLHLPQIFTAQTQWIADNHSNLNIKFVMHEGDIANDNTHTEWQRADSSMSLLDGVVPYSVVPGNHDNGPDGRGRTRDTTLYNQYFPVSRYQNTPTFGGVYSAEPNKYDNNFHTFNAGGTDWLVLSLEFGPRDPVLDWANEVVANHPDHRVIVVTHTYLFYDDTRHNSTQPWNPYVYHLANEPGGVNDGEEMWNEFVKLHSNIGFVFSGHVLGDGLGRLVSYGDFGNPVFQILTNYQMNPNGGNGYLRILEVDTVGNTFTAKAYSPYLDQYKTDCQNQFTYDMDGGGYPIVSICDDLTTTEAGSAKFVINLSPASSQVVKINYQTVDGSAIAGSDYTPRSGSIVFQPGDTTKTRTVEVTQDNQPEPTETFTMTLTNPVNATLGQSSGIATITGDGSPTLSIGDLTTTEAGSARFVINLSPASSQIVTVNYQTVNGSATAGSDYTPRSGSIVFQPGDTQKTRTVVITQDNQPEPTETFTMTLTNPVNATLGQSVGKATITDDDVGSSDPIVSISDLTTTEAGSARFVIRLSPASSQVVQVNYQTVNGSATAGSDYTPRSGSIVFQPGDTQKTRTVEIVQDNQPEQTETFTMTLSNPVNAILGQTTGTATISGDGSPTLNISDLTTTEAGSARFVIILSPASSQIVTVNYQTVSGSATAGSDYTPRSGSIVFQPGDTQKTRTVEIAQDNQSEQTETFTMTLSNPVNATLGQSTGTATITDDG